MTNAVAVKESLSHLMIKFCLFIKHFQIFHFSSFNCNPLFLLVLFQFSKSLISYVSMLQSFNQSQISISSITQIKHITLQLNLFIFILKILYLLPSPFHFYFDSYVSFPFLEGFINPSILHHQNILYNFSNFLDYNLFSWWVY